MNILPVQNNSLSFNGRIITKGTWTKNLEKSFKENPEVQKLASGELNVVGEMSHRKILSFIDKFHSFGDDTYKLRIYAEKENPTLLDKIKTFFKLNDSTNLTHYYHTEASTQNKMKNRIFAYRLRNLFNL